MKMLWLSLFATITMICFCQGQERHRKFSFPFAKEAILIDSIGRPYEIPFYFPVGLTKHPFPGAIHNRPRTVILPDSATAKRISTHLYMMKEPILSFSYTGIDVYRLILYQPRYPLIVVRMTKCKDSVEIVSTVESRESMSRILPIFTTKRTTLSLAYWDTLSKVVDSSRFWTTLRATSGDWLSLEGGQFQFILEGHKETGYNAISSWDWDGDESFTSLCLMMLQKTGMRNIQLGWNKIFPDPPLQR